MVSGKLQDRHFGHLQVVDGVLATLYYPPKLVSFAAPRSTRRSVQTAHGASAKSFGPLELEIHRVVRRNAPGPRTHRPPGRSPRQSEEAAPRATGPGIGSSKKSYITPNSLQISFIYIVIHLYSFR